MNNDANDDSRVKLYDEFRRAVTSPDARSAYFDEGDLIEIFDYAGDQGDDATRTEVIAVASRLYPESDDLKIRKAFYYYLIDNQEMSRIIVNGEHGEGVLWDILKLRLDPPSDDDAVRILDELFAKYDTLGDEEVIQFINLANSVKHLDWAIANIDEFRKKTSYIPTCLYEIAVLSGLNQDNETVIKMTEELTRLEPFTEIYWLMMARAYADMMQVEEAISAVDYALAIDSENVEAQLLRAQLKVLNDQNDDETIADVDRLLKDNSDNGSLVRTLGIMLVARERQDEAMGIYMNYLYRHPDALDVLELALGIHAMPNLVARYYDAVESPQEEDWVALAERLSTDGCHESAACVLEVFHEKEGLTNGFERYIVELYWSGQYKRLESMLDKPSHQIYSPRFSPMVSLCYVMSMVRVGRSRKVEKFINEWLDNSKNTVVPSPKERLVATGVSLYLEEILGIVMGGNDRTLDSIDPFRPMLPGTPAY